MGLLVNCPRGEAIADVPISDCPESLGQIQKVVFQRVNSAAGTKNKFVIATADPSLLASWTPLLAASDGTKVVQSPYIQSPENEPGESKEYGGGNETLSGIPIVIGRDHTPFTGNLLRVPQSTIKELKKLQGEVLAVYFIDEFGRIAGLVDDHTTPTEFRGVPITSLFIGDKKLGGFEGIDMNAIKFNLYPNWSDDLHMITPSDFDALTELVTP